MDIRKLAKYYFLIFFVKMDLVKVIGERRPPSPLVPFFLFVRRRVMRSRQTAFRFSMTSESLQEARRELTKYSEYIMKAWGCEMFLFIHNQIDSLEESLLNGEEESEEHKAIIDYVSRVIDVFSQPYWVIKRPLYRLDLFPDYEKKIRKGRLTKKNQISFTFVPFPALESPYLAVEKFLQSLEAKHKGLECAMVLIKDNPKYFYDLESEEGITFVVRMKVKK